MFRCVVPVIPFEALGCRSTGTDNKRAAIIIANEYEQASRTKKTLRQIQKTLENLREMMTGEAMPRATLRQVSQGWLATKRAETSPRTMEIYTTSVGKLLTLTQKADLPISELTRADLVRYRNALVALGLAARSVNQHLKVAKMIFKLARRDGLIADDPAEFVDSLKGRRASGAKRPFVVTTLKALKAQAKLVAFSFHRMFRLTTGPAVSLPETSLARKTQ